MACVWVYSLADWLWHAQVFAFHADFVRYRHRQRGECWVFAHPHICVCIHSDCHRYTNVESLYKHTNAVLTNTHTHVCMLICMYVCTYIDSVFRCHRQIGSASVHAVWFHTLHINIYVYIYIDIYMHAHIHAQARGQRFGHVLDVLAATRADTVATSSSSRLVT